MIKPDRFWILVIINAYWFWNVSETDLHSFTAVNYQISVFCGVCQLPSANGLLFTLKVRSILVLWPAEWKVAEIQGENGKIKENGSSYFRYGSKS